jgi:uncharacterized membrane protein (DUF2068 family)
MFETGVFHQVVAMIQLAHLVFQGLSHLALLGTLIIASIFVGFFPIYKVFHRDGLFSNSVLLYNLSIINLTALEIRFS